MLTREEAILTLETGDCPHDDESFPICGECNDDIIALLKQQPEHLEREIKEFLTLTEATGGHRIDSIIAICTDKTAWQLNNDTWHKLPPIPQEVPCDHEYILKVDPTCHISIGTEPGYAICHKCGHEPDVT